MAKNATIAPGSKRTLPYLVVCAVTAAKGVSGSGESIVAVGRKKQWRRLDGRGRVQGGALREEALFVGDVRVEATCREV
jgi:hypothetical protein